MKLKLLLLYSIYATHRRIQMTEMHKSLSETSMEQAGTAEGEECGDEINSVSKVRILRLLYRATFD